MKKVVIVLIVLCSFNSMFSQGDTLVVSPSEDKVFTEESKSLPEPKVTFDFDIRAAFTSGQFKQFYPKEGMGGLGMTVLIPLGKKKPLDVGFGFGYYFMSETKDRFEYYAPGIGDYDVETRVSGSMIPFHLVSRFYPLKKVNSPIQPYIEGLAGFRLFIVSQNLNTYVLSTRTDLPPVTESNTTGSWSYGFGAGLKVRVSRNNLLYLNAKVNQLYGTETNYMDPSSVILYDDGTVEYSNFRSQTDVLRFSIGLHLMLE